MMMCTHDLFADLHAFVMQRVQRSPYARILQGRIRGPRSEHVRHQDDNVTHTCGNNKQKTTCR
jgi:hypothetical protein